MASRGWWEKPPPQRKNSALSEAENGSRETLAGFWQSKKLSVTGNLVVTKLAVTETAS